MKRIKVLIIDDSALVRYTLSDILSKDKDFEMIGTASDPYIAAQKINETLPDVITLDIEMPRMDGLTFLRKLMSQHPIPVVIVSTLTEKGSETALKALEFGAIDVIAKPKINTKAKLHEGADEFCEKIKNAATANIKRRPSTELTNKNNVAPKYSADVILQAQTTEHIFKTTDKIIAVGASTGGTEAIKVFLQDMPVNCPGIIIVQHMPEMFTSQFAKRLNTICDVSVKEAENGDYIIPGHVLIAPGSKHMLLKRNGAKYYVEVKDGPLVNRHRPSVDVMFRSVSRYAGPNAIGVILTGMGDDGAKGLLEMKDSGSATIAQDEQSCIVFGMPKEAIRLNAADQIIPLNKIANYITQKLI
jgi:two-component system chemotaxis response regulator CheB